MCCRFLEHSDCHSCLYEHVYVCCPLQAGGWRRAAAGAGRYIYRPAVLFVCARAWGDGATTAAWSDNRWRTGTVASVRCMCRWQARAASAVPRPFGYLFCGQLHPAYVCVGYVCNSEHWGCVLSTTGSVSTGHCHGRAIDYQLNCRSSVHKRELLSDLYIFCFICLLCSIFLLSVSKCFFNMASAVCLLHFAHLINPDQGRCQGHSCHFVIKR